jgi:hypothetical protein
MVRAILSGAKTQTRRTSGLSANGNLAELKGKTFDPSIPHHVEAMLERCPYGQSGDRLWVRETFCPRYFDDGRTGYRADYDAALVGDVVPVPKWKPSIFMRPSESRITLEVVCVRIERVQAIAEEDAKAEGVSTSLPAKINGELGTVHTFGEDAHRKAFALLWDGINGKRAPWASNPWVWAVGFRRVIV